MMVNAEDETASTTEKPDYFAGVFPRDGFPQWAWQDSRTPGLPDNVWFSETSHRDGQQGGLPLNFERSKWVYDILCRITGSSGAIRQAEFFVYAESDRAALGYALERFASGAPIEPTTWIRATLADVQRVQKLGVIETGLLSSASDYHTFHKFAPGGRSAAARAYLDAVTMALDHGIRPRVHLEDTTRAPEGFVQSFMEAVLKVASAYPVELAPRVRVCDTMGIGLPFDDVALPRSVPRWIRLLRELGFEPEQIEMHAHNDTALAVANSLAAIRAGCGVISGTTLGTGERTGNAPLEAIAVHLLGMGYWPGNAPDLRVVNDLVAMYEEIGVGPAAKYPLFGSDAFVTRAGIHADGLNKFWPMYLPFDSRKLLDRNYEVALTKDSGKAGVVFLIQQHFGRAYDKGHPVVGAVHGWVQQQYDDGRVSGISWDELAPIAAEAAAVFATEASS
ncbi:MAG: hypothetical protein ACRCYU_10300 [Nocardioides sp.]